MFWLLTIALLASGASAQLTAQTSVAPELRECYMNVTLLDRNNIPPTTLPVLIDIIQKIEDDPNVNMDLRQLVVQILRTYRQDGIEYHQPDANAERSGNVLPYAPTFHSFHRHRIVLSKILPGNIQELPNVLTPPLKCALHYMLSTTVDARVRGNEQNCNQLSQLRALRTARNIPRNLKMDDVEILDLDSMKLTKTIGQMRHNPKEDVEYSSAGGGLKSERQLLGDSQCPLLGGVVFTRWGAVSAGHLLAGIAGGAQFQRIRVSDLVRGSMTNYANLQDTVSSTFATTISGDLAEAVLIQGTERGTNAITVGTAGNWNSTQAPRYFMLHNRVNVEATDPELRGDIDGFVLGTLIQSNVVDAASIKLSQLLDMYYSPRNGVYDANRRACNRRELRQQFINRDELIGETSAFAAALDTNIPLRGTIVSGLDQLVSTAVENFQSYTTNSLNDLNCVNTVTTTDNFRLKTNLYIVIDSTWPYQAVYPAISYLLDNIEVGKFGSSVTLLNAFDGSIVLDKTFSLADFHSNYTLARHQALFNGVNLESTLINIRLLMERELENEKSLNYVGGNSTVLLFLLNTANLQITGPIINEARKINETIPDLRILFATSTNQFDSLWQMVRDMHNDIKVVSLNAEGTNVEVTMNPVLTRVKSVGRRIVNSNCGSTFNGELTSGNRQFDDYVEPGYINYYAISPNYFFGNANRKVRISRTGAGAGSLIVCQSRRFEQPRQNMTAAGADQDSIICQTLASGNIEISLQGACEGHWTIGSCPSFFISVQSQVPDGSSLSPSCTDPACRFPYNMRYQVQIEEFGCFSSAGTIALSVILIICGIFIHLL
ncbi:unnamed protein product [Pieris macdunnoughi]|uniref:Uncharacterized protein n=1 Tax=Pieris macdunnoughi TaxID=345717 RepID=A0A821NS35_9NEOP|nr:unnamed protein product [Pieris macdunnoughi]